MTGKKLTKGNPVGGDRILLTGAPKTLIQNYVGAFKTAQLNLLSLETEVFALIRSLLGNDRSSAMIVQLGSTTTNIFVIDKCTGYQPQHRNRRSNCHTGNRCQP